MDRAAEFLEAVEAVEAGIATREQAEEVLAIASLSGRSDLAGLASAIIDATRPELRGRRAARRAATVGA